MDRGMTFLELLIALSLLLIFISLAVPAWQTFLAQERLAALINRLAAAIHFARSEAIKRHSVVTLCGSSDGQRCDGQWSKGQIVLASRAKAPLRYYGKYPRDYHLIWRSSLKKNTYLNFTGDGFTEGQQGTFYLCPPHNRKPMTWSLVVTRSGRLRVERAKVYSFCETNFESVIPACAGMTEL
ncbi:putative fimT protein [Coxiella burnetii Q321]|nr:GspH/FimT family pseudopilin [Coxiella burnetii]EDR34944.1 putative fimT protein [Coxiella burnetii Q321]